MGFLERLLHHYYGPQMPSGVFISTGGFGVVMVWLEGTPRTGNIPLIFCSRGPNPKQTTKL